jgi:hypothetical protein
MLMVRGGVGGEKAPFVGMMAFYDGGLEGPYFFNVLQVVQVTVISGDGILTN